MITEEAAKKQLEALYQEGGVLAKTLESDEEPGSFEEGYQSWYSRALPLMKQLGPDRYAEFQQFYSRSGKSDVHWSRDTVIHDYLLGVEGGIEDPRDAAARCFRSQLAILKSVAGRLAWISLDSLEQAERGLQLSILEAARDLIKVDERAAGVVAGSILESYLKKLAAKHRLKFRKQAPPLREYMDALHGAKVLDIPVHAQAIWLAEIAGRATAEGESPTQLQVRDLIDGSRWLITNIF